MNEIDAAIKAIDRQVATHDREIQRLGKQRARLFELKKSVAARVAKLNGKAKKAKAIEPVPATKEKKKRAPKFDGEFLKVVKASLDTENGQTIAQIMAAAAGNTLSQKTVSRATVRTALTLLIGENLARKEGKRKATKYFRTQLDLPLGGEAGELPPAA